MLETKLPNSIPDQIKMLFLENQKKEWARVVEMSEKQISLENQPENVLHWQKIREDAKERINTAERALLLLRKENASVIA